MRPIIRKNGSSYSHLIDEAAAAQQELLDALAPEEQKLTPAAHFSAALKAAGVTVEALSQMEQKVLADPDLASALRRMERALMTEPHWTLPSPAGDLRLMNYFLRPHEAGKLHSIGNSLALFALASKRVGERSPNAVNFGRCTDYREHQKKVEALQARCDELRQRLETEYGGDDLSMSAPAPGGLCVVTVKVTGGAVVLGPNLAERLVSWKMQMQQKQTAERNIP